MATWCCAPSYLPISGPNLLTACRGKGVQRVELIGFSNHSDGYSNSTKLAILLSFKLYENYDL